MAVGVEGELKKWFVDSERVVVAGIGNPIRSDDYIGVKILEGLQNKVSSNVLLLECETVPENYLFDIEEFKPTHVLLIDAAVLGLNPGEVSLADAEKIADSALVSTHMLPLKIFCDYVKQTTGAKIALLLVEPKSLEFGEGLSREVAVAGEMLVKALLGILAKFS